VWCVCVSVGEGVGGWMCLWSFAMHQCTPCLFSPMQFKSWMSITHISRGLLNAWWSTSSPIPVNLPLWLVVWREPVKLWANQSHLANQSQFFFSVEKLWIHSSTHDPSIKISLSHFPFYSTSFLEHSCTSVQMWVSPCLSIATFRCLSPKFTAVGPHLDHKIQLSLSPKIKFQGWPISLLNADVMAASQNCCMRFL